MAPEVLANQKYTDRCDVYSFSICMYELFYEKQPYRGVNQQEDLDTLFNLGIAVMEGKRPLILDLEYSEMEQNFIELMKKCWDQDPNQRPSFYELFNELEKIKVKL